MIDYYWCVLRSASPKTRATGLGKSKLKQRPTWPIIESMEELGDISYHIFVRLDDRATTALLLTSPAMAAVYDKLKNSQLFWRGKIEQALIEEEEILERADRPDVDWEFVYRNVKAGQTVILADAPISSVNTLRVLREDLGMELWMRLHPAQLLANPGILNYLIDNAEEIGVPGHSVAGIMGYIARDNPPSVAEAVLVDVLKNPKASESIKELCTSVLIEEGITDNLVEITEKYAPGILKSQTVLSMAMFEGDLPLMFVFSVAGPNASMLLDTIENTNHSTPVSKVLLDYVREHFSFEVLSTILFRYRDEYTVFEWFQSAQFSPSEWRSILDEAVRTDVVRMAFASLEHVNPSNQDLLNAMKNGSRDVLLSLLSDNRINSNLDVRSLLLAPKQKKREVRTLILSPKLNIDSLDRESLEIVAEAFDLELVSELTAYPMYKFYEPNTAYWFIVRYLFLKGPTEIQLLGYIRDSLLYTDEVRQALASVLDERADYSDEAAPIRALLFFLVYPKMDVTESEKYLRTDDEYSDELVHSSNFLIKLFKNTRPRV